MSKTLGYILNPRTLLYDVKRRSRLSWVVMLATLFVVSVVMTVFYFWIYVSVLGLEPPKTLILKKENAEWCSKMEVMNRHLTSMRQLWSPCR